VAVGVIMIKPILDSIGYHSVVKVSFYSSVAVFLMSIVSTLKQISNGVKVQVSPALILSFGSICGGVLGNYLF